MPVISLKPWSAFNQSFQEALYLISSKGLGVVSIENSKGNLVGIVTDGDVRRLFTNADKGLDKLLHMPVKKVMSKKPIAVFQDTLCIDAVKLMEDNRKHRLITVLPVIDEKNHPIGTIHIHDLIRRGFTFSRDNEVDG